MLTKDDLQQIRGVVRDEVKSEVGTQLKFTEKRLDRILRKMQNSILQYHDEYAIYLRKNREIRRTHRNYEAK
jgi:cob(I)alamin adenosyltransferase